MTFPPLLITSSVFSFAPFVKLTDPGQRIILTLEALEKWISFHTELKVVICDGSNFDFSDIVKAIFPKSNIECLAFSNNQTYVWEFGKGWGEGEIVNYALANSDILLETTSFTKCTAKLFVSNFATLVEFWNGKLLCDGGFRFGGDEATLDFIQTMFYIIDKELYLTKFSEAHTRVRDAQNYSLEHCFKEVVEKEGIERFMPPIVPLYEGVSGTTAAAYSDQTYGELENAVMREFVAKCTKYVSWPA